MIIKIFSGPVIFSNLFFLSFLRLKVYGFFLAIGLLMAVLAGILDSRRKVVFQSSAELIDMTSVAVFAALFGSRVLYFLSHYREFDPIYKVFLPSVGGFSLMGGFIFGGLVLFVWAFFKPRPVIDYFNFIAVYCPLAEAIGRFGCLFAGCCYGFCVDSSGPWINFLPKVYYFNDQSIAPSGVLLIASPALSIAWGFCLFLFLFWAKNRAFWSEKIVWLFLFFQGLGRIIIDWTRGQRDIFGYGISVDQIAAFGLLTVGIVGLILSLLKEPKK